MMPVPDLTRRLVKWSELTELLSTLKGLEAATTANAPPDEVAVSNFPADARGNDDSVQQTLAAILVELRTITYYLQSGLNVREDPEQIRLDQIPPN